MPIPLALAAAGIGALSSIGGNLLNNRSNRKASEAEQEWSREMYDLQRQHALSDWDMVNAYNAPEQQMQRLREAGLSPHLVYGKGAQNTGAMVKGVQAPTAKQYPTKFDLSGLGNSVIQGLQANNTQANTDNLHSQSALNAVKQNSELAGIAKTEAETKKVKKLMDLQANNLIADTQLKQANQTYTLNEDQRRQLANTKNVALTTQDILLRKAQIANTKEEKARIQAAARKLNSEARIAEINADLYDKYGITPESPYYVKYLMEALDKIGKGESLDLGSNTGKNPGSFKPTNPSIFSPSTKF